MKQGKKACLWRTIRGKMRISYFVIIFIMCAVLLISYFASRATIEKNAIESSMATLTVVSEKVDGQISYIVNLSDLIYNSSIVNSHIRDMMDSSELYERHYNYVQIYRSMQDYYDSLSMNNKDCQIMLFNREQGILYYSWTFDEPQVGDVLEDIPDIAEKGTMRYAIVRDSYGNKEKGSYCYFYNLYSGVQKEEDQLCVIIGIRQQDLDDSLEALEDSSSGVTLMETDGRLLYQIGESVNMSETVRIEKTDHNVWEEANGTFITHEAGETYLNLFTTLDTVHWKLVQTIRMKDVMQGFDTWWKISIFCLMLVIAAVFAVLYLLDRSILKPVNYLYQDMERMKEGQKPLRLPERIGKDEIGNLTRQFYEMVGQIEVLEEQRISNEKQKRRLEIEALQAQINPHFLYNTINAVKMVLRMGRNEEAGAALTALVDILKNTLSNSNSYVTLQQEEQLLQSYLFIQHLRYDDFQFRMEIPEDLKKYRILKFMIQPFIENCFLHGFEEITSDTRIEVCMLKADGHLKISISDNGNGMDEEVIREIKSCRKKERGLNGIGIGNVIERVRRNYGDDCYVDIRSELGEGTHILLVLPLLGSEPNEDINR